MRRIALATTILVALLAPSTAAAVTVPIVVNPWRVVSEASGSNLDDASAVRAADGTLHVVYRHAEGPTTTAIRYRTMSKGGTWSTPETVVSGWSGVTNADIELAGGTPHVFWAGIRTTDPADPARSGQAWYASRTGGAWSMSAAPFSTDQYAYVGNPLSTALATDGTPWATWSKGGRRIHSGFATGTEEPNLTTTCCDYATNIARDAATGDIYTTYYADRDSDNGYFTQRIAPTLGDRVMLPGGRYGDSALSRGHRLAAASRTTGGVYAAYCDRSPSCTGIRVGAVTGPNLRLRLPGAANAETVWTAAAPLGRMWVSWADSRGVWAARSNKALTQWGAVQLLKGPRGFDGVWSTGGNADRGTFDLFANINVGEDYRIWQTRVRPKLSITPPVLLSKNNIARTVKLRLTDAGDVVPGAIRFRGVTKTVDALGYAEFVVPAGAMRGVQPAIGSSTGYVPGRSIVRITR